VGLAFLALLVLPAQGAGTKYLFWTRYSDGALGRAVLDDQGTPPAASAVEDPWIVPQGAVGGGAMVVYRNGVYWIDRGGTAIRRALVSQAADASGSADHTFLQLPNTVRVEGLSVDSGAGYLFFGRNGPPQIAAVNLGTGAVTQVLDLTNITAFPPAALRVDAAHGTIYWAANNSELYATSYDYSGANGTPAALATQLEHTFPGYLSDIALADNRVFVSLWFGLGFPAGIYEFANGSWSLLDAGTHAYNSVRSLRPAGTSFLFADAGRIWSLPRAGGVDAAEIINTGYRVDGLAITLDSTAVSLASFSARPAGGGIALAWTTGAEVDAAGFHVLRAGDARGPYVRVNDALIPAQGSGAGGASYSWLDGTAAPGRTWHYRLEDVDTRGAATLHGPVQATAGATVLTLEDLEGLARAWGRRRGEAHFDPLFDLDGDGTVGDPDARLGLAAL